MKPPIHCNKCSNETNKVIMAYSNDGNYWKCPLHPGWQLFGKDEIQACDITINGIYIWIGLEGWNKCTSIIDADTNKYLAALPESHENLIHMTEQELLDWLQMIVIFS